MIIIIDTDADCNRMHEISYPKYTVCQFHRVSQNHDFKWWENFGQNMAHKLVKIGPIYGTKNSHGKIHGLKKRILEYILSRYFIVIKYLQDEYRIYKNCIFSRLFKKFWWEKYGANYGQNLTNLCAIFCPWCFLHSKFLKDFNSHSHTGVTKVSTKNHTFVWFIFLP